jgi:hypothetical protein
VSRRHNSSRRKSYGRRQHEIRERQPGKSERDDWAGRTPIEDWLVVDPEDERQARRPRESFGGSAL